jgi:hypothetical protein
MLKVVLLKIFANSTSFFDRTAGLAKIREGGLENKMNAVI